MLNWEEFLWLAVWHGIFSMLKMLKKTPKAQFISGSFRQNMRAFQPIRGQAFLDRPHWMYLKSNWVILQKQAIWIVTLWLGNSTCFLTAQHKLIFTSKLSFRVRGQLIFLSATCFHGSNWLLKTLSQTHTRTQTHTHTVPWLRKSSSK